MKKNELFITYGAILGFVVIIYEFFLEMTGLQYKAGYPHYISHIVGLAMYIVFAISYSRAKSKQVTFGQLFGQCMRVATVAAIIIITYRVAIYFAIPNLKDKSWQMAQEIMAKNPRMTDDLMETAKSFSDKWFVYSYFFTAVFGPFASGAIFGLIASGTAPKKPENPFSDAPESNLS